jgi:glycerophosphoryl diester phosphodiesterase
LKAFSKLPSFVKNKIFFLTGILFIPLQGIMAQSSLAFEIQGHRGSRGLMPENTIQAFLKAIDEGVHTLEMDVVISKDKMVVVSHDPFFDPRISTDPSGNKITEKTTGNLYLMDYKDIRKYDVGKRGHPAFRGQKKMPAYKPLLRDVIAEAEKYAKLRGVKGLKYNIEIKSLEKEYNISQPEVNVFTDLVAAVIRNKVPAERITIQSFDYNVLKHWYKQILSKRYPEVSLSLLLEPADDNDILTNLEKLGFSPDVWSPNFIQVNADRVNQLHGLGIRVIPWTVNNPSDMKKMKELGCDGLITDYPDRAKHL